MEVEKEEKEKQEEEEHKRNSISSTILKAVCCGLAKDDTATIDL